MGRGISFRHRIAIFAAMLAVVATALSSCSWPWEHPAAAAPAAQGIDVSFPGAPSDLKAEADQTGFTQTMKDAVPDGAVVHQPVELKMTSGSFPSTGAQVSFRLDQPVPAGHQATIAYWNEQAGQWEGRATDVSDDRRTITAKLEHFSTWAWVDTLYNGIGQVMGDKTSPPACPGSKPSWADPTFNDDVNGTVLWCVGTDAKNPDILEVHLKMNRSSAGSITTGIKPAWAWGDLWQNLTPVTWTQMAADTAVSSNVLGEQYLIQPLGEYRFGFNRKDLDAFWRDHPNQPLIEVGSSPVYAVAGLLYQAIGDKAQGGMAGVYIMASLLECGGNIAGAASSQSVKQTFGAVVSCMNDRKDAIAQGMARAWSNLNPGAAAADDVRAAGANIGKAVSFAGYIYATAKLTLSLGAFLGDLTLNPAARQLSFFPSNDEVKRYVQSLQGGGAAEADLPAGMTKYTDPVTGNTIAAPDGWPVMPGPGAHELVIDGPTQVAAQLMPEEELPGEGWCNPMPYQLLDSTPVQIPGIDTSEVPTTVKTEVMDDRATSGGSVVLTVQIYGVPGTPAGNTTSCGGGGQFRHGGKTGSFAFAKDFPTPEAAKAYLQTDEYQRVKAMISSLRFGPGYR